MMENILTATPDLTAPTCKRCGAVVHDPCTTAAQQESCQLPADCYPDGRRKGRSKLVWDKDAQALKAVDPNPSGTRTVTIVLPSGYATAEEFAKDCGFELAPKFTP